MVRKLKEWKNNDDKTFIITRASKHILKCIEEHSCVTITGSSGVGKTCILRHVALQMAEKGYDILLVTDPGDIVNFYSPNKKTLFVVDDLCGNFSVNQSDLKSWEPVMEKLKEILANQQTKLITACRLQIYKDTKFESLSIYKSCVCNLLSEDMCLSKAEKQSIAETYLKTNAPEISGYHDLYECFPLLCKLYHDNPKLNVADFFQNPFSVYEKEMDTLYQTKHYTKYCALALCVMFNNKLIDEMLVGEVDKESRTVIENTCDACSLNKTSRLVLRDELNALEDTLIKKEQNMYRVIHDNIFDFLTFYYGKHILKCLIENANICLIKERFVLEQTDVIDNFITVIPSKYHQIYIQRMIDDWSKGKVQDAFSNINMKKSQFRRKFLSHLSKLDLPYQKQLAHTHDRLWWKPFERYTVLLKCCVLGDISFVLWSCNLGVNINECTYYGQSPIMEACEHGHAEIVKLLLDRGANFYYSYRFYQCPARMTCDHGDAELVKFWLDRGLDFHRIYRYSQSLVTTAYELGHTEIVKLLLDKRAGYNKYALDVVSLVMKACEHGETTTVEMLLNLGADCNTYDYHGESLLIKACEHGQTIVLKMLLDRGADCNKCDRLGQTPVMNACKHGDTTILNMLLVKGADFNICDSRGQSPLMKACEYGFSEIVKILLDRGADCNTFDINGVSLVMKACEHGHTEVLNTLLDRGSDCNKCNNEGQCPLMKACRYGYSTIAKLLLEKGTDINKCDWFGQSPLMAACKHGHTVNVKILLDRGAEYNKCDLMDQSPLMQACIHGHTEIVKMLLDTGANFNNYDKDGESPVMMALKHDHSEIL